jgi:NAD(P)-dependent dehydrogenase (short-subunit alcohol dehydrogenase family)
MKEKEFVVKTTGTALVTGGGSGVGRAVALALAEDGWTVAITGRTESTLLATVALAPGQIVALPGDVTDSAAVDAIFAQITDRFGRLDLLFNNAGVNVPKIPLDALEVADLRRIVDINLFGALLCARAAMSCMKRQTPQGGRIINNGSVSAYAPRPNTAPYTATKHAITGLTKSISLDGRAFNIACGQIDIGNAAVERTTYMQSGTAQADGTVAAEAQLDVAEVGRAVAYMAALPLDVAMPFVTLMASAMPLYGRG